MTALMLDASVAISWCFPGELTEDTPYSRRVLTELATTDRKCGAVCGTLTKAR
jgi:hypothetical protein